jgi:hypothetical protein
LLCGEYAADRIEHGRRKLCQVSGGERRGVRSPAENEREMWNPSSGE